MKFKWVIGICIFILMPAVKASAANADVKINEIMYNPLGDDSKFEFVELKGFGNLENYSIEGINFVFPENSSIDGYLIISKAEFEERYGIKPNYTFSGSLKNTGEKIRLVYNNTTIDEVSYSNIADEDFSLEFNGIDFISSIVENGTPFELNSVLNVSFEANTTNNTTNSTNITSNNTTNSTNVNTTENETVNTTLMNESNSTSINSSINSTNNSNNTTQNSSPEQILNETINTSQMNSTLNITEIVQEIEATTEETVDFPVIQSFYTLTKKFVEGREIKFFTYIHNKANFQKTLQAVFDHNGILQSQSIELLPDKKQKLTFITALEAGNNDFILTLFDNGFAVDIKIYSLFAEAIEVKEETEDSEGTKEKETQSKFTRKVSGEEIKEQIEETNTLNAIPKAENQAGKDIVERFKNDTPIQIQAKSETYEGSNTKNKRLIGYMLLGFSALLNIVFIWRR